MASVSMAARDSFRVTVASWVNSQARSLAVRSVHLPATRTRFTPRGSYSFCNCVSSARTSTPAGRRFPKAFSSSGPSAANSKASRMRSSSARSVSLSLSPTITRISATFPMGSISLLPIPCFGGQAAVFRLLSLAHVKRCKSRVLVQLEMAFAHQFQRRGKARCHHRRFHRRLHQIFGQILIERAPLHGEADQPLQRLARFGERPHRALGQAHERSRLGLAAPGIGGEQVVERRRPFRMFYLGDRLGRAALENLTAELRPVEQLLGDIADDFEPAQPLRQRIGHVFGAQPIGRMLLRQQQARFQISEPRRHHQIIGGKLQAQLSRRFDEGEVLVGQREDGDFGQVDFLLAREREQEIERALKTLDVDDQRRLIGGSLRQLALELIIVGVHATTSAGGQVPFMRRENSARPAATSKGAAGRLVASAAAARRAASPASAGAAAATACISASSPLQCKTMSQPAATAAAVRSDSEPDKAPMEMSSLIKRPRKPIESRITPPTITADKVAGATASMALNTTCAVMPSGRPASGRKAAKSLASSVARSVATTGSRLWLSAVARPWPGICLSTGSTPPSARPSAMAPAMAATLPGSVP